MVGTAAQGVPSAKYDDGDPDLAEEGKGFGSRGFEFST